ncbi:hypothetical protein CD30_13785 [Ureibacillus massiliensis 4400831 = CIP 108448 = CCUG 49529]|uniref:Bacterial membrane protein YfhO n=1 Tax=Ureibacillus massiliensis 4400831 = CIP 108448 = CCUG 49529 TaxID=1211035 RepID=A0A0A3JSQ5_9BACL|nr:YfhO family protein [Ureibacillus massiliensis]KGR90042.1 hypothetical protein CD30_13785 [Ureibacillus massiliensis 4400831 = CIP 108448 = CCUG 49529]
MLKRYSKDIFIYVTYCILPFVFYFNFFYSNGIWGIGDALESYAPNKYLYDQALSNFELPFWNNGINLGISNIGDIQSALLYLPNLLLYSILPFDLAYNYLPLFHLTLAGIFTYMFLKQIGVDKKVAFLGGVTFMFSAVLNVRFSHVTILNSIIWLPLVLYFYEKLKQSMKIKYVILMSFAYSMQILAGFIQIAFYTAVILLVYFIFSIKSYENIKLWFKHKVLFSILVLTLTAFQIIPTLKLSKSVGRDEITYDFFSSFSLPIENILTLFFPYFYGTPFPENQLPLYKIPFFGEGSIVENGFYIGIIPIFLALYCIFKYAFKERYILLWSLIISFSLLFALGSELEFINSIFYHIPGFNYFRVPSRILFVFSFGIVVLSSLCLNKIIFEKDRNLIIGLKKFSFKLVVFLTGSLVLLRFVLSKVQSYYNEEIIINNVRLMDVLTFSNTAITIPVILMLIYLGILMSMRNFKDKNPNLLISILFIFIFIDLHLFNFYNINKFNDINKDSEMVYYLESVNDGNDRIWPVLTSNADIEMAISPNKNLFNEFRTLNGYVTFMSEDKKDLLYIDERGVSDFNSVEKLLVDNTLLSSLNIKYIIINNVYKKEFDLLNRGFTSDNTTLIDINKEYLPNSNGELFLFTKDIKLEKNNLYKVSLSLERPINGEIFIDFYGENFDLANLQTVLRNGETFTEAYFYVDEQQVPESTQVRLLNYLKSDNLLHKFTVEKMGINSNITDESKYQEVFVDNTFSIYKNKNVLETLYSVSNVIKADNKNEINDYTNNAIVHSQANLQDSYNKSNINIINYSNGQVKAEVNSKEASFIVFSESYDEGWRAYINNKAVPIYQVNNLVQGIEVPKGSNIVEFRYVPIDVYCLLLISIILCFICLIYLYIDYRRDNNNT